MDFITLIVLALGLSVDSFAVSIGCGFSKSNICLKKSLIVASSLAIFQGLMPVIGWFLGSNVKEYVSDYDHWIAFILLTILGGKMIFEKPDEEDSCSCSLSLGEVLMMSIGTSIDALVIGFSFAFLAVNITHTALVIGGITFIASMIGLSIGKKTGSRLGHKAMILGGIVLILIGLKILIEHLYLGG
ncbi:manganese efflux pump [Prolixibacteraceae bacterium JC049]|nr:manganese efflux pump [Prolixibacteraceae bacterium JC049]